MSSKRQEIYKRVFEDLTDYADGNGIEFRPRTILTDLELAAINATRSEYPAANNKVCFFRFAQCVFGEKFRQLDWHHSTVPTKNLVYLFVI